MSRIMEQYDFSELSFSQRMFLVQDLWESLRQEADAQPLSDTMKAELDSRMKAVKSGEMKMVPWEKVREELHQPNG